MMTGMAFRMSQMKYGKGLCNIEFCKEIEVRNFLLQAYPAGVEKELNLEALEQYGLAVNFAKLLQGHEEFVISDTLSSPSGEVVNVYCGHIPELPTLPARIVVDESTVKFLAGGFNSFLSLKEGYPVASARIEDPLDDSGHILYKIYFCERVIPVP